LTTIITSVVVSLVVSLITLYVFQPIQGQRQLRGEIASATRLYRTATSKVRAEEWQDRQRAKAEAEEATQALLVLSARLGASLDTFPAGRTFYRLLEFPKLVAPRENVNTASSELRSWAYWIRMGDSQAAQRHRLEVIKALGLPRD
jgi:hypothetical protein